MKFKIYKNIETNSVEKIVTGPIYFEVTEIGFIWEEHNTENILLNELEKQMLLNSFKYAVPGKCEFRGGVFKPKEEFIGVFEDATQYYDLLNDKWVELRVLRNTYLGTTDWTQLADAPIDSEKKTEWAAYRQALRDVPSNTVNPYLVDWPIIPT